MATKKNQLPRDVLAVCGLLSMAVGIAILSIAWALIVIGAIVFGLATYGSLHRVRRDTGNDDGRGRGNVSSPGS